MDDGFAFLPSTKSSYRPGGMGRSGREERKSSRREREGMPDSSVRFSLSFRRGS